MNPFPRLMVDAASPANIPHTDVVDYQLVGGYLTGTPGQAWTGHLNDFPGKTMVTIDQAAKPGSPAYQANVMDVEPECYRPSDIITWMFYSTADRPTVYCDRDDYPAVRKVWAGDIWLAAPGVTSVTDPKIIGVQNKQGNGYDVSVIFDQWWPYLPPSGEQEMLHAMIAAKGQEFVPFPVGSFKSIILFHDFTHVPEPVRVAVHSKAHGYTLIRDVTVDNSIPVELTFTETDVDAVSLVNRSAVPVGWTLT